MGSLTFAEFTEVVLGITIEMTSCESFMSMKITEHWLKVLWKVSCTCSCVFYNGFLFMKYILAQEDIHLK